MIIVIIIIWKKWEWLKIITYTSFHGQPYKSCHGPFVDTEMCKNNFAINAEFPNKK